MYGNWLVAHRVMPHGRSVNMTLQEQECWWSNAYSPAVVQLIIGYTFSRMERTDDHY